MPRLTAQLRRSATPLRLAAGALVFFLASGFGAVGGFSAVWPGTQVRFGMYIGQGVFSLGMWEQRLVQSSLLVHASPHYSVQWLPSFTRVKPSWEIKVPLWLLTLPLLVAHSRHHRLVHRRKREGCCAGCGYALSGLPPGVRCPECGLQPPAIAPTIR